MATGNDTANVQPKRRSKLPPLLRWAQVALFTLFFADTYVYSILDTLLGRYLGTLGITQEHMSLAYNIYGIAQLVGSIAVLLLQSWPTAASIRLPTQYTLILVTVVVACCSTLLMVLAPASYQLLLVARAIQGTMGAVYTIYAMVLLVQWFPLAWQMQAVAFMTAGQTSGDSLAPVLGAVLYDTRGIVSAYLTQTIIFSAGLGVLLLLGVWWGCSSRKQASSTLLADPSQNMQDLQICIPCEEQLPALAQGFAGTAIKTQCDHAGSSGTWSQQQCCSHDGSVGGRVSFTSCGGANMQDTDAAGSSQGQVVPQMHTYAPALVNTAQKEQVHEGQAVQVLLAGDGGMDCDPCVAPEPTASTPANKQAISRVADADYVAAAVDTAVRDQGAESPEAGLVHSSGRGPMAVWQMLRQWSVVCECGVVLWAQMLRAALDVLAPLAMYTTPTWVVGLVFLGEAGGALVAPFLLDLLLVHVPRVSTRAVQLVAVACMAVSGPLVMLFHLSVPGATVFFTCFGAAHSVTEALVFKHLVDQVGSEEAPGVLIATMSAFSLFYVAGFTVGAFIAGAPRQEVVLQQQLALAAVAGGMMLYVGVYGVLLRRKCITSSGSNIWS